MATKDVTPDRNAEIEATNESALPELESGTGKTDQVQVNTLEIDLPDNVADGVTLLVMDNFDLNIEI